MEIRAATVAEHAAATERIFREGPAAGNFLWLIADGGFDPADLLVAVERGALRGAMIAQPLPGHLAVVAPPSADDPSIADALVRAAIAHLEKNNVRLVQAYLDSNADATALERDGFRFITRIEHRRLVLARRASEGFQNESLPDTTVQCAGSPRWRVGLTNQFDPALFAATLVATHEGSLDAPEANIGATAEEIDSGYAATCERRLAMEAGQPIGVLILSHSGIVGEIEYYGVVPSARGRGVGAAMLHHAIQSFRAHGVTNVSVAVDERNIPARKLYERLGFQFVHAENLLLRRLD